MARMKRILLALCLLLAPVTAMAQAAAPAAPEPSLAAPSLSPNADAPVIETPAPAIDVQAEKKSVQAWGQANTDCSAWSDGCVACTKDGCSTPGIACVPQETSCRRK